MWEKIRKSEVPASKAIHFRIIKSHTWDNPTDTVRMQWGYRKRKLSGKLHYFEDDCLLRRFVASLVEV